jgi:iron complex transport system substrate-binding protein
MSEPRIVSLIASATEIVCALGFKDSLVGRSHECDYPEAVKDLPQCTSPKFRTDGTSYQIDERVRAIVQEGLSVYRVDASMLEHLKPTHIITQDQCQVCAVSLNDVEEAVCRLTSSRPRVVSLKPNCLSDIWDDIERVGEALSALDPARALVSQLRGRMDQIAERARKCRRRPGVAAIEWIDPLMAGGNWMPELISMAGGTSLFGEAGKHSPAMSWDDLVKHDPEMIFVVPCGFDMERTLEDMRFLTANPHWYELKAVRSFNVFIADGNQYFNRPGPRVVESLEILAEVIHPEEFRFGHQGRGWLRFDAPVPAPPA